MSKDTKNQRVTEEGAGAEGARRATGAPALGKGQRWSRQRKLEVVMRVLGGESLASVSREVGLTQHTLQWWVDAAVAGMSASLSNRKTTAEQEQLKAAQRKIGEIMMENELLKKKAHFKGKKPTS